MDANCVQGAFIDSGKIDAFAVHTSRVTFADKKVANRRATTQCTSNAWLVPVDAPCPQPERPAFHATIVTLLFTDGCTAFCAMMFSPVVPVALMKMGLDAFQITCMGVLPLLASVVSGIMMGRLSDKFGRKKVLVADLVLLILVSIAMSRCSTPPTIAIAFLLVGALTCYEPALLGLFMGNTEEQFKMQILSARVKIKVLCGTLGASAGGAIYRFYGWAGVCWMIAGVTTVQVTVGCILWPSDEDEGEDGDDESESAETNSPRSTDGFSESTPEDSQKLGEKFLGNGHLIHISEGDDTSSDATHDRGILDQLAHFVHPVRGVVLAIGCMSNGNAAAMMCMPFILHDHFSYNAEGYSNFMAGFSFLLFWCTRLSEWQINTLGVKTCICLGNILEGLAYTLLVTEVGGHWAPFWMYIIPFFSVAKGSGFQVLLDRATPEKLRGEVFGVFGAGCALLAATTGTGGAFYYDLCWRAPFLCSVLMSLITLPLVPLIKEEEKTQNREPLLRQVDAASFLTRSHVPDQFFGLCGGRLSMDFRVCESDLMLNRASRKSLATGSLPPNIFSSFRRSTEGDGGPGSNAGSLSVASNHLSHSRPRRHSTGFISIGDDHDQPRVTDSSNSPSPTSSWLSFDNPKRRPGKLTPSTCPESNSEQDHSGLSSEPTSPSSSLHPFSKNQRRATIGSLGMAFKLPEQDSRPSSPAGRAAPSEDCNQRSRRVTTVGFTEAHARGSGCPILLRAEALPAASLDLADQREQIETRSIADDKNERNDNITISIESPKRRNFRRNGGFTSGTLLPKQSFLEASDLEEAEFGARLSC